MNINATPGVSGDNNTDMDEEKEAIVLNYCSRVD